jgi:ATP-dependent DNA ligase
MIPVEPPFLVMDAQIVHAIPQGPHWVYEPKWDGFRCLAFRDGDEVQLQAKSGKPLTRYFPDVVALLGSLPATSFVIDSELVIFAGGRLSFDELQMRLHPAESRVRYLAAQHPATVVAFDLLVDDRGEALTALPFSSRRSKLEDFLSRFARGQTNLFLSPQTTDVKMAEEWLRTMEEAIDGVVAKRLDMDYRSGERTGMVKYKTIRSADCVVGGYRYLEGRHLLGSLLLGLYDDEGLLHHVGFTSGIRDSERAELTDRFERLRQPPGFTGRAPGGPSRWSSERSGEWEPVRPELVVEVEYDRYSGGRFRHGTRFVRWRPDKAPKQCTFDQMESISKQQ